LIEVVVVIPNYLYKCDSIQCVAPPELNRLLVYLLPKFRSTRARFYNINNLFKTVLPLTWQLYFFGMLADTGRVRSLAPIEVVMLHEALILKRLRNI